MIDPLMNYFTLIERTDRMNKTWGAAMTVHG